MTTTKMPVYEHITEKIKELNVNFDEKFLFQVDVYNETDKNTLNSDIIKTLQQAMAFLNKITPNTPNETLTKFQTDFYSRYGDREIPFMEALDPEMGIGFPSGKVNDISPLIDDFYLPPRPTQTTIKPNMLSALLLEKTLKCLSEGKKEITIEEDDIKNLKENWDDLPLTMHTLCEIISYDEVNNPLMKISQFGGSCGANWLGRFCHTDVEIENLVNEITQKEQELMPDAIIAEIVHLPENRIGNIVSRPHIRKYELLYLSYSDLSEEHLIRLSDLTLSIKGGKLVIKSKKLNKEIIPRLTTAHNYHNNPMPVYRFLCEMQTVNQRSGIYFSWGHLQNELKFKPRVSYSNIILSPATWLVAVKDIKHLFDIEDDEKLLFEISKWRKTIDLPSIVLMPDGDNELYVDFENILTIKAFFAIIKKRQQINFAEFLHNSPNAIISSKKGKYTNEFIFIFHK